MRVKKFEAKNMKDALQMVKHELGPDAVILSARDNRKTFGLAGEASVEITAAVSESTLQKKKFVESRMTANDRARFANSDARTQRQIITKMVDARTRESEVGDKPRQRPITSVSYIDIPDDEIETGPRRRDALERARGRNVRDLLKDFDQNFDQGFDADQWQQRPVKPRQNQYQNQQQQQQQQQQPPPRQEPQQLNQQGQASSETALSRIRNAAREAWQTGFFSEEAKAPSTVTSNSAAGVTKSQAEGPSQVATEKVIEVLPNPEIVTLKSEINRLHKVLEGFQKVPQSFVTMTMHPGADYGIPFDLSFMYQKLIEAGLTIDHTVEILQQAAKEIDPVQIKKRPIVDAWVARWFLSHIQTVQNPWQGRVHLFVGGAGSGKTSSLVKMASQLVVKEKKKIAILSTDAYKVGAVDQLKIYCQILNVPFAVIRNRKDWEWVLSQLHHVDHILVDYPGFQLREIDEIHLLKSLLPPSEAAPVTHFCVSATSKDGDAFEIARRYKVTEFSDVIFTSLDQSVQHGIIYNLHRKLSHGQKMGKPLHSFGIGNRIPEDFEMASKERVLDLIFKLTKLRRETK